MDTNTRQSRLDVWRAALQDELRELMQQASTLKSLQQSAKTQTKRSYYTKKLAKVAPQVHSTLVALEQINNKTEATDSAPPN